MGDNPRMNWNFTKMHGAGNDFVVLDGVRQAIEMTPERARALGDRHFGIGADQILLVEPATRPDADFRYRIFNSDGSEVEHCGNGARCFVRFVHEQGLSDRNPLRAEIATGILLLNEGDDEQVTVDMGSTRFDPAALPFDTAGLAARTEGQDTLWELELDVPAGLPRSVALSAVAISNPHAVQVVDNVDTAPVALIGPLIETHPRFARRVNAGFMQIVDRHHIRLRVHERGAGETLACGTGACAAVAAGIRRGLLDSPVRVQTRGGVLTIAWNGEQLRMTGPAESVFTGQVDIDKLVFSMALNR
ncbi:MAG: diaminopimelate epimerase [Achromobacter sp.]|uniref:diaminopimelate epimerase n=1 Tax=Achromobacter sp. TaxID=134375 RepID=UPI003D077A04